MCIHEIFWLNCRWLLYLTGTPLGHSSLFWAWHSVCTEGSTSKFFVNISCIYLCFTIAPALYIFVWFQEINSILYLKSYNFFPAQGKCWGSNSRFFNNYQAQPRQSWWLDQESRGKHVKYSPPPLPCQTAIHDIFRSIIFFLWCMYCVSVFFRCSLLWEISKKP